MSLLAQIMQNLLYFNVIINIWIWQRTDHLMRFKYFSNDFSFSIVASVPSQISGCIRWNSLLMPWVVSEQEQRLWLSNGGREIPFIIISIILNLNPGPNLAHSQARNLLLNTKTLSEMHHIKDKNGIQTLNRKYF